MTHQFTNKNPFYKSPAFALAVTAAFVLWVLFVATSCVKSESKQDRTDENLRRVYSIGWKRGADVMIDAVNQRLLGKNTSVDSIWASDSIWFEQNVIKQ